MSLVRIAACRVPTSEASRKTINRRTQQIGQIRSNISGGESSNQLQEEVRCLPKEERQKLLREGGFTIDIPPEHGLAMKADLALPWSKLRVVTR